MAIWLLKGETVGLQHIPIVCDFAAKNLGWSPIRALATLADTYTRSAYATECRHCATIKII